MNPGHPQGGHPKGEDKKGGHPGGGKGGPPIDIDTEALIDVREKGAEKDGERQHCDRRLFMQLTAFGNVTDTDALIKALKESGIDCAMYADVNDPKGIGLITMSEEPGFFV
ncbi:MAG: hypothetical protein KAR06_12475, partial [Deltaproteobacteria bacterium]|nr:hypothetical protein [Deltaproteobacteria bacterium]